MTRASVRRDRAFQELQQRAAALQGQLERNRRILEILYNISLACRGSTSFRDIFEVTYRELCAVFALDACYIALADAIQHGVKFPVSPQDAVDVMTIIELAARSSDEGIRLPFERIH